MIRNLLIVNTVLIICLGMDLIATQGLRVGNLLKIPERLVRPVSASAVAVPQPLIQPAQQWIKIQSVNCTGVNWLIYPNNSALITSPHAYNANTRCTLILQLRSTSHRMAITFEKLDLETSHDWLKIISGSQQNIVTGNQIPAPLVTDSDQAKIEFHSDHNVQGSGFVVRINQAQHTSALTPPETTTTTTSSLTTEAEEATSICGQPKMQPDGLSGQLSSPLFPNDYPENLTCQWTIAGPENSMIRLQISKDHFDTEPRHDVLQLTGRPLEALLPQRSSAVSLATLSGQLLADAVLINPLPVLDVQFTSDKSVSGRGFLLKYRIIPRVVETIVVNGHSGVIQSPDYPLDYRENQRLTWIINGFTGGSSLRLIDLQLDSANGDHLLIGKGQTVDSDIVSVWKGSLPEIKSAAVSIANSSRIYLHFVSTFHLERRRGWIVSYEPIISNSESPSPSSLLYGDNKPPNTFKHVKKEHRRLLLPDSPHLALRSSVVSTSHAVRDNAIYPESISTDLMEIEVEPFHPSQNWQEDLQECLGSMFPRGLLRLQKPPTFKTTIIHTTPDAITRVVITSTDTATTSETDILAQLRSTLLLGKVRCNDSLEMYLPGTLPLEPAEPVNRQNWLLVSVAIVAFFIVIFSVFLVVHCKRRRRFVRKLKVALTPSPTFHPANFEVVMEPATQKNPLYQVRKNNGTNGRTGVPRYFDHGLVEPEIIGTKLCPPLSRNAALEHSVCQNIPSITQYNRQLDIILEPIEEDVRSAKSSQKSCETQREAETGEMYDVSDAVTAESYANFVNEWRNGRPMTVRALKQKSQFKKQIKRDLFDEPDGPNHPSSV